MEQTANGPELMVSPIPSLREPYIVPNEIGTNRPMTQRRYQAHGNQTHANQLTHQVISSNSTIGSDTASWALRTPFAVTGSAPGPLPRAAKARSVSAPPRTGSSVASLIHDNPSAGGYMAEYQNSRGASRVPVVPANDASVWIRGNGRAAGFRSGDSVASHGSTSISSRSVHSSRPSSRSGQPTIQMSLADLINANPNPTTGTSNSSYGSGYVVSANNNDRRPVTTLRRPPGANSSSAASAIHGGPFATNY